MKSLEDKDLIKLFNSYLHIGVDLVQIVIYILVFFAIFRSIGLILLIFLRKGNELDQYNEVKILINNTISICLSGIVFVEIMKLFYIKTYKQLGIIGGIIIIKLFLLYFISEEREKELNEKNYFN